MSWVSKERGKKKDQDVTEADSGSLEARALQSGEELKSRAQRAFDLGTQIAEEDATVDNIVDEEDLAEETGDGLAGSDDSEVDDSLVIDAEVDVLDGEGEEAADVDSEEECSEEAELSALRSEVEELREAAKDNFDKYLRAVAELDNYKKRAIKERSDLLRYAGENIARDLVDIIDDFERALEQDESKALEILGGVKLIYQSFCKLLERHSILGIDNKGKPFDPETQEALATVPALDSEPGLVVEQFKKTYKFKDKLLRPGQVVVSVSPPAEVEDIPREELVDGESSEED